VTGDKTTPLDGIRAEIDRIDDAILALLGERMAAVEAVRAVKAGDSGRPVTAMRPDREAQIIRRLVGAKAAQVPAGLVERVWREIIASATHVQVPLAAHVCASGPSAVALDLVHARFGTATPVVTHDSPAAAVRAVVARGADVAVVALKSDDQDWVAALLGAGADRPRVMGCLPFLDCGGGQRALVVGHAPLDGTGDDTTVIALLAAQDPPDSDSAAGLEVIGSSGRWRLAGAKGLVSQDNQLMKALKADPAHAAVEIVGAFANPIRIPDQV
jgi:chorismate mutase